MYVIENLSYGGFVPSGLFERTQYVSTAKEFETKEKAEKYIETLPPGYYKITKVYKPE